MAAIIRSSRHALPYPGREVLRFSAGDGIIAEAHRAHQCHPSRTGRDKCHPQFPLIGIESYQIRKCWSGVRLRADIAGPEFGGLPDTCYEFRTFTGNPQRLNC
jgi:hypothetical protein